MSKVRLVDLALRDGATSTFPLTAASQHLLHEFGGRDAWKKTGMSLVVSFNDLRIHYGDANSPVLVAQNLPCSELDMSRFVIFGRSLVKQHG